MGRSIIKTVEQAGRDVVVCGELIRRPDLLEQTAEILRVILSYLAVKLALGELDEDGVRAYQDRVAYGRRMMRYMDQVFYGGEVG
jgi:hypothetical protein